MVLALKSMYLFSPHDTQEVGVSVPLNLSAIRIFLLLAYNILIPKYNMQVYMQDIKRINGIQSFPQETVSALKARCKYEMRNPRGTRYN